MKSVKILSVFLLCFSLLCLASCQIFSIFFASVFPLTLSQAVAETDLSGSIPADAGKTFEFSAEMGGTADGDYVLLFSRDSFVGPHILIFDPGLQSPPLLQLDTLPTGFDGRFTMTDTAGFIILGNQVFDPMNPSAPLVTTQIHTGTSFALYEPSVSLLTEGYNVINLRVAGGQQLTFQLFTGAWGAAAMTTKLVGPAGPYGVLSAYAHNGSSILYVLVGDSSSKTSYCIPIPFGLMTGSIAISIPSPGGLLELYPPAIVLDFIPKTGSYGFSGDVLVVFRDDTRDFTVYKLSTGLVRRTLHDPVSRSTEVFAYRAAGTGFYVFETKKRTITRFTAWWQ